MPNDIHWHSINEDPPLDTNLLFITNNGALLVGGYMRYRGKVIRCVSLAISDDALVYDAGYTVLWARLPGREEVMELIRKENE